MRRSAAGILFRSGDAGSLVDAACRLMTANLGELGRLGRAHVEAHHGWDMVFDRLFEVYRGILNR